MKRLKNGWLLEWDDLEAQKIYVQAGIFNALTQHLRDVNGAGGFIAFTGQLPDKRWVAGMRWYGMDNGGAGNGWVAMITPTESEANRAIVVTAGQAECGPLWLGPSHPAVEG